MKYAKAITGFVSRFFGWLIISMMLGIIAYFAISVPLISLRPFKSHLSSFIGVEMVLIPIAVVMFSWRQAHRFFLARMPRDRQRNRMIGAYLLSLVLCVGGLFGTVKILGYFFEKEMFGIVSWHQPTMGFSQPVGYAGPSIPRTAQNIHIEQTGWLDPYLMLRFEDQADHLKVFASSLKIPLKDGIYLPGEDSIIQSLLHQSGHDPRFVPFAGVRSVQQGRSFLDEKGRRCLVIDDETRTLYYFLW